MEKGEQVECLEANRKGWIKEGEKSLKINMRITIYVSVFIDTHTHIYIHE